MNTEWCYAGFLKKGGSFLFCFVVLTMIDWVVSFFFLSKKTGTKMPSLFALLQIHLISAA